MNKSYVPMKYCRFRSGIITLQIMTWPSRPTRSESHVLHRRRGVVNIRDSQLLIPCCHRKIHENKIYMFLLLTLERWFCWLPTVLQKGFFQSLHQQLSSGFQPPFYSLSFCPYVSVFVLIYFLSLILSNHILLKNHTTFPNLFCWANQASFLLITSFTTQAICFSSICWNFLPHIFWYYLI